MVDLNMPKKQLTYLTSSEITGEASGEVREVLSTFLSAAAARGIAVVTRWYPAPVRGSISILDCGTASGRFPLALFQAGFQNISAADIADYRSDEIRGSAAIKEFRTADFCYEALPWSDATFDAVTAWEVIEHLENPHHFIRQVHRILKPGGVLFLALPNIGTLHSRKYFFWSVDVDRYTETNNHIAIFTRSVFKKTVLRYFDLLTTEYRVDQKIYRSRLGWLKRMGLSFPGRWREKFGEWFGADVFYILRRKTLYGHTGTPSHQ